MEQISVVVPVYNVDDYLPKCIESIMHYNFFEVILVDDGSTDNSGKICDEYSNRFNNIKVIHQDNKGLSGARNTGILAARGEYLMFVDSDDYLMGDIDFDELYDERFDIVQYRWVSEYETKKGVKYVHDGLVKCPDNINYKQKIICLFKNSQIAISAWSKIVRRELIINHHIFFTEKLISEDVDWSLSLFLQAKSFKTNAQEVYVYRKNRSGSITNTKQQKAIDSLFYILKKWTNYDYEDEEFKTTYFTYLSYWYVILLTMVKNKQDAQRANKYKFLLKYTNSRKMSIVKVSLNIFGFKATIKILRAYIRLHSKGIISL